MEETGPADPSGRMGHNFTDANLPDPEASYVTDKDAGAVAPSSTNDSEFEEHPAIAGVRSPESILEALQDEIEFTKAAYSTESSGGPDFVDQDEEAPVIATMKSPESLHEEVEFTQEGSHAGGEVQLETRCAFKKRGGFKMLLPCWVVVVVRRRVTCKCLSLPIQ